VDKQNSLALNNIGNIYFLQERLDDARQAYEAALSRAGRYRRRVNLARVLFRAGRGRARKVFRDARKLIRGSCAGTAMLRRNWSDEIIQCGIRSRVKIIRRHELHDWTTFRIPHSTLRTLKRRFL